MKEVYQELSRRDFGQILDVCCGAGQFCATLQQTLRNYDQITGVDVSRKMIGLARQYFAGQRGICFELADAAKLPFNSNHFDLTSISNSLHHLNSPKQTLAEMRRVLAADGTMIVSEMYSDVNNPWAAVRRDIHHWLATIDTLNKVPHYPTLKRQEILDLVTALNPKNVDFCDRHYTDEGKDGPDKQTTAVLQQHLSNYLEKASAAGIAPTLLAKGQDLLTQLETTGAAYECRLEIVAYF